MNKEYGDQYEKYVLNYLINAKKYKNCYLWKDVPSQILLAFGLVDDINDNCQDVGCDILCVSEDDKYVFVQCKNYSTTGKDNNITIDHFGLFFYLISQNYDLIIENYVYYTGKVSHRLLKLAKKTKFINLPYVTIKHSEINDDYTIMPRDYQIEAYNKLRHIDRSILEMPCGTGKTLVSYLLSHDYDNVIILTPLISTTEQILEHFKNYNNNPDIKFTEIDSSSGRNHKIDHKIKNIIASTYKSCDIINEICATLTNYLVIIDEFHNLSENNLSNKNDELNKLLMSKAKILFVSATPKYNKNLKNIFGDTKYTLSWSEAIEKKYICNIDVIYPNVNELTKTTLDLYKTMPRLNNFENKKINFANQTLFMLSGLKETNSKKCIVFLNSIDIMNKFINMCSLLSELIGINVNINSIDFKTPKNKRKEILERYEES